VDCVTPPNATARFTDDRTPGRTVTWLIMPHHPAAHEQALSLSWIDYSCSALSRRPPVAIFDGPASLRAFPLPIEGLSWTATA
jgi:hypothetical protein